MPPSGRPSLSITLPDRPLTRFAPSPTGFLHLGHVVNAVYVWGLARAHDGRVIPRLEDHDRGRCRPEYEAALLDDLEWLGLEPDLGRPSASGPSPWRQSDCGAVYQEALSMLSAQGLVFGCDCSRREIDAVAGGVVDRETPYPGRCRERGLPTDAGGVRLRMASGTERFIDARLGEQRQEPAAQCGDMLLRDRLGQWTYQFAVVVDDLRQGVDLVIRGEDLLESTGRQIRLAHLLGRARPPVFYHHPLIRKPGGAKLSKAAGDSGIRDLRAAGYSAEDVLGRAAHLGGLLDEPRPVGVGELAGLFSHR